MRPNQDIFVILALALGAGCHTRDGASAPEAVCGNAIVEPGEACDGPPLECEVAGYAGTSPCILDCTQRGACTTTERCGDGIVNGPEVCDGGTRECMDGQGYSGTESCNLSCDGWGECLTDQFCGDGVVNGPESCDDGSANGSCGFCDASCAGPFNVCGDGQVACGEGCDTSPDYPWDGCDQCEAVFRPRIPWTGRTKCFDESGEIACPLPGEPFYGQDGSYPVPMQQFVDNEDGTVSDPVTGLMWQQGYSSRYPDRLDPDIYCDSLNLGQYQDWRLPSPLELATLYDMELQLPGPQGNLPSIFQTVYFNPGVFSRSLTLTSNSGWYLDMRGLLWYLGMFQDSNSQVRCVRGAPLFEPRPIELKDGILSDPAAGLEWAVGQIANEVNWADSLAYCEGLDFQGRVDWRLPNLKQAISLMERPQAWTPAPILNRWTSMTNWPAPSAYAFWFHVPFQIHNDVDNITGGSKSSSNGISAICVRVIE